MFWTVWAENAKIERSFMDGSDRRTLISSSLSQPNGITIDYYSAKIYWSDSDLDKIEYSNYDGSGRTVLETSEIGVDYPFSLTIANNLLFWTDLTTNKVYVTQDPWFRYWKWVLCHCHTLFDLSIRYRGSSTQSPKVR